LTKRKVICPIYNLDVQKWFFHQYELAEMSHIEAKKIVAEREKQLVDGIELFDGSILRRISKEDIKLTQPKLYKHPLLFVRVAYYTNARAST